MKRSTILTLAFIVLLCALRASGQELAPNARQAGLAGAGGALVSGLDAIGINPARIVVDNPAFVSVGLFPTGVHVGTDFITFGTYKQFFTGRPGTDGEREPYYLQAEDKNAIFSQFPGSVGKFSINGEYRLFSAAIHLNRFAAGFDVRDRVAGNGVIPRDFVDFLFFGNAPGRTYDLKEFSIRSSWTRQYAGTFAFQIPTDPTGRGVAVGISAKYIEGFGYAGIDQFESQFTTDPDSFVVYGRANMLAHYAGIDWLESGKILQFELFPQPVGNGLGFDLGISADVLPNLTVAAAVTDIGSMTWNRNAKRIAANHEFTLNDLTDDGQVDDIQANLEGKEEAIAEFSSTLPTAIGLAAAYALPMPLGNEPLYLALSYRQGLNNEAGNTTDQRFALGAEWSGLASIPLRVGIAYGGLEQFVLGFGAGFRIEKLRLDLGTGNIISAFSDGFSSTSFSITTRLDF